LLAETRFSQSFVLGSSKSSTYLGARVGLGGSGLGG
jgi:hypothetical protein